MTEGIFVPAAILFLGMTSLYALLALFQGLLPTRHAAEIRKLDKVKGVTRISNRGIPFGALDEPLAHRDTSGRGWREASGSTLNRMLQCAAWPISPMMYRVLSLILALGGCLILAPHLDLFMLPVAMIVGPWVLGALLRTCMARRSRRFSGDYPQLLMGIVALLKTGMTPLWALEVAAQGLEDDSLVRKEIYSMLERMRIGLPEEKSIGSFGQNVDHPEIELFVQSLLLGLRTGGSLTDSLERLSTQVRKRHYFKSSAVASVAQQRGSIVAILIIMFGLASFLAAFMPQLVQGLYLHPVGWMVLQGAIVVIVAAFAWVNKITSIKI